MNRLQWLSSWLRSPWVFLAITLVALAAAAHSVEWRLAELWLTPDQRAQHLLDAGEPRAAADHFTDPFRRGVALFAAGEFEDAAAAFARDGSAESHYNRGNALVMRGKYDDAVEAYDRALALRNDWTDAADNRRIAAIRAERLRQEGGEGTGGKLGADDIVINEGARDSSGESTTVEGEGGELSDAELRSIWLRRTQTKPADFLRSKFAYQLRRQQEAEGEQ